jgi:hypothetical protein
LIGFLLCLDHDGLALFRCQLTELCGKIGHCCCRSKFPESVNDENDGASNESPLSGRSTLDMSSPECSFKMVLLVLEVFEPTTTVERRRKGAAAVSSHRGASNAWTKEREPVPIECAMLAIR